MMMHRIGMLVFLIPTVGLIGGGPLLLVWLAPGREIAQARYTGGEINREQYLTMQVDLG